MADTARLAGRQPWLRTQANSLVDRLKSRAMELPVAAAEVIVADRVAAVAATLQISERAARAYFDQDALDGIADGLVASVADEEPGVDLLTLPCDAALSISGVGRLFAALGQCAIFFASYAVVNEALSHNRGDEIADLISILGLVQAGHQSGDVVLAPRALLFRIARILESTADLTSKERLRDALRRDALIAKDAGGRGYLSQDVSARGQEVRCAATSAPPPRSCASIRCIQRTVELAEAAVASFGDGRTYRQIVHIRRVGIRGWVGHLSHVDQ